MIQHHPEKHLQLKNRILIKNIYRILLNIKNKYKNLSNYKVNECFFFLIANVFKKLFFAEAEFSTYFFRLQIHERPLSDESITSTQSSEIRRGTLYKRPGPPTPSKNGGRLSFGGTDDISRAHILRESNNNNREISSDTIVDKKMTPNSKTGRQFRSMFSLKGKDEVCLYKHLIIFFLLNFSVLWFYRSIDIYFYYLFHLNIINIEKTLIYKTKQN